MFPFPTRRNRARPVACHVDSNWWKLVSRPTPSQTPTSEPNSSAWLRRERKNHPYLISLFFIPSHTSSAIISRWSSISASWQGTVSGFCRLCRKWVTTLCIIWCGGSCHCSTNTSRKNKPSMCCAPWRKIKARVLEWFKTADWLSHRCRRAARVKDQEETWNPPPLQADTVGIIFRLVLNDAGTSGPMGGRAIVNHLNRLNIRTRDGGS